MWVMHEQDEGEDLANGSQDIITHFAFLPGSQSPFGFLFQYIFFFLTLVSFWKVVC